MGAQAAGGTDSYLGSRDPSTGPRQDPNSRHTSFRRAYYQEPEMKRKQTSGSSVELFKDDRRLWPLAGKGKDF